MIPTLVLDPDRSRQYLYREVLGHSFSLVFADSGEAALKACHRTRFPVMIVCADLPGTSGVAFCQQIRKAPDGRKVRVLLVGEQLDEAVLGRDTARRMGADDLAKLPLTAKRLRLKMRDLVAELAAEAPKPRTAPSPGSKHRSTTAETRRPPAETAHLDSSKPSAGSIRSMGALSREDLNIIGEERLATVLNTHEKLGEMDYYAILGLKRNCKPASIKRAYFRLARRYHPDRFALVRNTEFTRRLATVFKLMSEAYQVLGNPRKRKAFDEQVVAFEGGERDRGLRLVQKERQTAGPKVREAGIGNPQARKFYKLALAAMNDGDLSSAKMNLTLALNLAPKDRVIKTTMAELEAKLSEV